MLWGLFALSIPIIIHLLNRRRHRTVKWAAMDFLLKATRESRGKKKLKHILILTCRALAVSCLVFAISRPLLGGFLGFGATVDTVIFILDRSASMERVEVDGNPTKRELVLQQVSDAMAGLETAKLLLLDSATGQITEISSPETLPELSLTGPTDTAADLPSLAEDSRWPAFARTLTDLTSPTSVRIIALPDSSAPNCSLRLISSRRTETQLTLECELARKDDLAPLTVPVTLNVNGVATTESLTMPGQTLRFRRQIPISSSEKSGLL